MCESAGDVKGREERSAENAMASQCPAKVFLVDWRLRYRPKPKLTPGRARRPRSSVVDDAELAASRPWWVEDGGIPFECSQCGK